jgi:hypothetical protein
MTHYYSAVVGAARLNSFSACRSASHVVNNLDACNAVNERKTPPGKMPCSAHIKYHY